MSFCQRKMINPIPIMESAFPIPNGQIPVQVTQISFPSQKSESQVPIYPFWTVNQESRSVACVLNMPMRGFYTYHREFGPGTL